MSPISRKNTHQMKEEEDEGQQVKGINLSGSSLDLETQNKKEIVGIFLERYGNLLIKSH